MAGKLVLLHTVASLVAVFKELSRELLPADVRVLHVADEMLLDIVLVAGGVTPLATGIVADHVMAAERAGAQWVMFTCSSISPCADVVGQLVSIPVYKIDRPMVDRALSIGSRIGVVATAPTTLKPTTDLINARARALEHEVVVDATLCAGAYAALFSGDTETHDAIVRQSIYELMARNDVVVLAQASMARLAYSMPESERIVPVLSSPRLALEHLKSVVSG
ncbi:MAG: aspartate/glutamate racemase family protein [Anaerolineae bacterium]|nr:aspartate/glutamate racemase family protein [Anaerolineae bacterium]